MLNATYIKYTEGDVIVEKWTFGDESNQERQRRLLEAGGRGLVSSHVKDGKHVVTRRRRKQANWRHM